MKIAQSQRHLLMPDAPIQVAPWTRLFVGRERELTLLREMLLQCAPSLDSQGARRAPRPALAVLVGDSGQGKSRLVQEFYRRIACSPAKGGLDPDDYWPDAFADPEHCAKVVNPELPAGQTVGKTPPFIFWGCGGRSSPRYLDGHEPDRFHLS